jgi:hypothetical protein
VLPWATTYRHVYHDAHVEELLPGERVNCFFIPDGEKRRGWLVHYQDEMCQMQGHGHAWVIQSVQPGGRAFTHRSSPATRCSRKPRDFELADEGGSSAARRLPLTRRCGPATASTSPEPSRAIAALCAPSPTTPACRC